MILKALCQNIIDKSIVEDGQRVAEAVLWAEAKLGELLKPLTALPNRKADGIFKDSLPEGITWKQSHEAQQLANNPEENII